MWKNQDEEESDDSEKIRQKKKGRFRTVMKVEKGADEANECEIFETEIVDSDEPLSDQSEEEEPEESRFDDTILSGTDQNVTVLDEDGNKKKKKKPGELTFESQEVAFLNRKPDYGPLVVGEDIIDDEMSTQKAFRIFRNLELDDEG